MVLRLETKAIHSGQPRPGIGRAVNLPIFQSSTFEYQGETRYDDILYIRLNNTPNHRAVSSKVAELEGGEAGMVTASGMAAITTSLLTVLEPGTHLLAQGGLYGGTHEFVTHELKRLGIEHDWIAGDDPDSWKRKIKQNTRAIYVESITNPLMEVPRLQEVVRFAREHDLLSLIDNTFATPVNFRPIEIGFDLVLHSATKYLNGHNDIVAGVLVGAQELVAEITSRLNHLGGSLDPHACFLLDRGIKTLPLRVRYQNESALQIAGFLADHEAVDRVNYPGLEEGRGHSTARSLFTGYGGMLSFEIGGDLERVESFLSRLRIPIVAPSLGGAETLIIRPAVTSHAGLSPEERAAAGISDTLIRLSVGLEATADLIEDLDQALR